MDLRRKIANLCRPGGRDVTGGTAKIEWRENLNDVSHHNKSTWTTCLVSWNLTVEKCVAMRHLELMNAFTSICIVRIEELIRKSDNIMVCSLWRVILKSESDFMSFKWCQRERIGSYYSMYREIAEISWNCLMWRCLHATTATSWKKLVSSENDNFMKSIYYETKLD